MTKLTEEDKKIIEILIVRAIMYHTPIPVNVHEHGETIAETVTNMINNIESGSVVYSFMDRNGNLKK